jgi:Fe-S-cluster containining protein
MAASKAPLAGPKPTPVQIDVRAVEGALGRKLSISCSDRTTTVPLAEVLSALRMIVNRVADEAVERERRVGRQVSCRAGCGACCRQLVPLSRTEAQQLPELIAGLEPEHRGRVMARFEAAILRLCASGILSRLEKYWTLSREECEALVSEYFGLGIACPFLEGESCSIHAVRPLICRQYLVTSDPVHCANLSQPDISRVAIAADVFTALTRVESTDAGAQPWIPLILAPFERRIESEAKRTVPDWLSLILSQIEKLRLHPGASSVKVASPVKVASTEVPAEPGP